MHGEQRLVEHEHGEHVVADLQRGRLVQRREHELQGAEEVEAILHGLHDRLFRRFPLRLGRFRRGLSCLLRCTQDYLGNCMPG